MASLNASDAALLRLADAGILIDVEADGSVTIDQRGLGEVTLSATEWQDLLLIAPRATDAAHDQIVSRFERELHQPRRRRA